MNDLNFKSIRRNRKLSTSEMLAMRAKLPEPKSHAEEKVHLQLMGQYPDDPDAQSLYEAARKKWGVESEPRPVEASDTGRLVVRRASDIVPRPIRWLWRRRLPLGRYVELVGFPGVGKTTLVMDMIARLTTDGRWPDGTRGDPCDVMIVAAEDEAEDVLVPRLIAAGADLARVHFVDGIRRGDRDEAEEIDLSRMIDFDLVVKRAAEKSVGLIYIDALDDVLGSRHDGRGNAETRRALAPVRRLARQTGAAVLGLRHPTKHVGLGPALNQGNGSIAYGAVARGSLLVTLDPSDPERRLLLATKSNIARLADTLAFRLEERADDDDTPPKLIWDATSDPRMADEVLAELRIQEQANPNDIEREQSKLAQAEELVRAVLTGEDGNPVWVAVTELNRLAGQRGVAPKTLRSAKENLGLKYDRDGGGPGSWMVCALPGTDPYLPISRDKGKYGAEKAEPALKLVEDQATTVLPHTCPSDTCPSEETGRGASTMEPPADGPEPPGGAPDSDAAIELAHYRARVATLKRGRAPGSSEVA